MLRITFILAILVVGGNSDCIDKNSQCGGNSYNGTTTCCDSNSCIEQNDGNYGQCISCDADDFHTDCVWWSTDIREAAEESCGLSCYNTTSCVTENMQCGGSNYEGSTTCCDAMECVLQTDGNWAQCIDCDETEFGKECVYWSSELLEEAEKTCGLSCNNTTSCVTENMQCGGSGWGGSTTCCDAMECVLQTDGNWAQCIDCDETEFGKECVYWSSELLEEAEKTCGLTCTTV